MTIQALMTFQAVCHSTSRPVLAPQGRAVSAPSCNRVTARLTCRAFIFATSLIPICRGLDNWCRAASSAYRGLYRMAACLYFWPANAEAHATVNIAAWRLRHTPPKARPSGRIDKIRRADAPRAALCHTPINMRYLTLPRVAFSARVNGAKR